MSGGQANFLQSLGWAVLNSLWQLALLWVLYQAITGLFRKLKPSEKSSLATLLLVSGFAWFLYTFIDTLMGNGAAEVVAGSVLVNAELNPELNNWFLRTLPFASVAYLVLLVFPLLHFIRNYRYVQVIRKFGLEKIDVKWRIFVNEIAARMGIRKKVRVWVSELVSSPVTIGFLKPVILVPLAAINHLTPQQVEAVLLHELSHIRRFDYLVNLVLHFIQAILYFNPFAKAFVKLVEKEREKSCDEMVLQFQYDSHEYASALLILEKTSLSNKPLTVGVAGKKNDLLYRVELILGVKKNRMFSFNRLAGFMAGLLCVIALNALLIITRPGEGNRAADIVSLASIPGYFTNFASVSQKIVAATEQPATITNHIDPSEKETVAANEKETPVALEYTAVDPNNPEAEIDAAFRPVAFEVVEMPLLNKMEEAHLQEALQASRKVLESKQWKAVERSIADVFTQKEKEQLKACYQKEMEKMDWKQWENKLRAAYDKVDWDIVNVQLYNAVNQVRFDSLQQVYTIAISKLSEIKKELIANNIDAIPDTDVSLKKVNMRTAEVLRMLNTIKSTRTKKIVHL